MCPLEEPSGPNGARFLIDAERVAVAALFVLSGGADCSVMWVCSASISKPYCCLDNHNFLAV